MLLFLAHQQGMGGGVAGVPGAYHGDPWFGWFRAWFRLK